MLYLSLQRGATNIQLSVNVVQNELTVFDNSTKLDAEQLCVYSSLSYVAHFDIFITNDDICTSLVCFMSTL